MPQIPVFDTSLNIPSPAAVPRADPNMLAAPGAALAQGGAQVSAEMSAWEQRYSDAKRQSDAAAITAQGYQQLGDAAFRAGKVADHKQALDQFSTEATGIQQALAGQSSDPLVQSYVQREMTAHVAALTPSVRQQAFGLEAGTWRAGLEQQRDTLSRLMATAPNDLARAQIGDQFTASLAGGKAAGYLMPEEATQQQLRFASQTAEVKVRQDMLADPSGTAARLLDPATAQRAYPGLLPETSEVLAMRADNRALRMETRAAAGQAHADAMAERTLRRTQSQNETNVLAAIYSGQNVDMNMVADAARNGLVSPGGLDTIHSALIQGLEGHNDPQATVELEKRLGQGSLTSDDIHQAVAARTLKGSTALDLMRALNEQGKQGETSVERGNFSALRTALNGAAVESGTLFGKPDQAPVVQRYAEAQQEWTRRVRVGHEDSTAVLQDMLARYAPPIAGTASLPRPRFGAVNTPADLDAVAVKTYQAFQNHQIDQPAYDSEVLLLNRLRPLVSAAAAPPRAPAVPGKGGPAPAAQAAQRAAAPAVPAVVAPFNMFGGDE